MNKSALFLVVLLLMLISVIGCESDDTNNPVASTEYAVWFGSLPDTLQAIAGEEISIPVTAVLQTDHNQPPGNIGIQFLVSNGSAEFDNPSLLTDNGGRAESLLRIHPVGGFQLIKLKLIAPGGAYSEGVFVVRAYPRPVSVVFDDPVTHVIAHQNRPLALQYHAYFRDINGANIPSLPIVTGIVSRGGTEFGIIDSPLFTDENGRATFSYSTLGGFGEVGIFINSDLFALNHPVGDTLFIGVTRYENQVGSLTIRAEETWADPGLKEPWQTTVIAKVKDHQNNPLPDIAVNFAASEGSITGTAVSDANGNAKAVFHNELQRGYIFVEASISGSQLRAEATIEIAGNDLTRGSLNLSTYDHTIYADWGLTSSRITAWLRDNQNRNLAGERVVFHSSFGEVESFGVTDAQGRVTVRFTDMGEPLLDETGNAIPVIIYGEWTDGNLIDSVEVTILPSNRIYTFTLRSNQNQMTTGSGDQATITATIIMENGAFATPGTYVHFEVLDANGSLYPSVALVESQGKASTEYTAGNFIGTVILRAYVIDDNDSTTYSNEVEIELLPGPPNRIRLFPDPSSLETNNPNVFSTITVFVTDTAGNPVSQGIRVLFTTTMGGITPSAITNNQGMAQATLTPGVESGVATVVGTINLSGGRQIIGQNTVTFIAGTPHHITLSAFPEEIFVDETARASTTLLTVRVLDPNNNPIGTATTVMFEILNQPEPPQGCALFNGNQIDSARTANGVAVQMLSAGFQVGGVLVRAYTWRDGERTQVVSVINDRIHVSGGRPSAIDIDYSTVGEDAGGGTWKIPVTARVYDSHLNPAHAGLPVGFTVVPDDVAMIENGATDENGLATVNLFYQSSRTFEPFTIAAEVQVANGQITAQRQGVLPLQRGHLELHADPGNWRFDRENGDDTCLVRTWAILTDGHGVLINKAPVLFTTDRAAFYWLNPFEEVYEHYWPNPARRLTGADPVGEAADEPPGTATVYLRGPMNDFFLDDDALEATCTIRATVEGEAVDAEPVMIFMTRR